MQLPLTKVIHLHRAIRLHKHQAIHLRQATHLHQPTHQRRPMLPRLHMLLLVVSLSQLTQVLPVVLTPQRQLTQVIPQPPLFQLLSKCSKWVVVVMVEEVILPHQGMAIPHPDIHQHKVLNHPAVIDLNPVVNQALSVLSPVLNQPVLHQVLNQLLNYEEKQHPGRSAVEF